MAIQLVMQEQGAALRGDLTVYEVESFKTLCAPWLDKSDQALWDLSGIEHLDTAGLQALLMWQHFSGVDYVNPSKSVLEGSALYQLPVQWHD